MQDTTRTGRTGGGEGLSPLVLEAADEVAELALDGDTGRFAMGVCGSTSKGTADALSDVDFRCYSDEPRPEPSAAWQRRWEELAGRWRSRGVVLDDLWWKTVAEVDAELDRWLAGHVEPEPIVWTVWGYQPLTDFSRQVPVIDPDGLVAGWRDRLVPCPDAVRRALVARHLPPLRYWRTDYHYRHKVARGDEVFLAGLTSTLVHHVLQVLGALNGAYYPGDGNNAAWAAGLDLAPDDVAARLRACVRPGSGPSALREQRDAVLGLVDDVEALLAAEPALTRGVGDH